MKKVEKLRGGGGGSVKKKEVREEKAREKLKENQMMKYNYEETGERWRLKKNHREPMLAGCILSDNE